MKLENYSKYYIQGSDHYLIPKDIFVELFDELIDWKQENKELNKQHKKLLIDYCRLSTRQYSEQQEFIKYLEEKINHFKDLEQFAIKTFYNKAVINLDLVKRSIEEDNLLIGNFEEILTKYKEIIGVKDE